MLCSLRKLVLLAVSAVFFHLLPGAHAAEWQWSVPVESVISGETKDHPRAFLWIPPGCERVRAVVVGQHNMEEEPILEHAAFRQALSELGFAEVWVTPGFDLWFNFEKGAGETFDAMMKMLAQESGYAELERAPVVPLGHSAAASFPWNFAAWNPSRTLAVLSVSGQWPYWKNPEQPAWGERSLAGVPGLVCMGEYEDAAPRAGEGLKQRAAHPEMPLSMLQEPGAGHFDATDAKIGYLSFYLKKAAQYRLTGAAKPNGETPLTPIDPAREGWLADRWRGDEAPQAAAAPVGKYAGEVKDAFWFFDEETARVTEKLEARDRGKKTDLVGYVQDGKIVEQNPKLHAQVALKFLPVEDGLTFKLIGSFLDTVPEGRPEKWAHLAKGATLPHAEGGGPIVIDRICGPVQKRSDDTFAIRFYRMGMTNQKLSADIWLRAVHPGDADYRRAVQQASMSFPLRNLAGADQAITFPELPDQPVAEAMPPLQLDARSDAGARVHYYVREGPAEIVDEDTLQFTPLPPRSRFPVKVTVVAWQWGRSIEPLLKTAAPVERTFLITK